MTATCQDLLERALKSGGWREELHPRGSHGRWISKRPRAVPDMRGAIAELIGQVGSPRVKDYLQRFSRMTGGAPSTNQYVLEHGRSYRPPEGGLPGRYFNLRGTMGLCYKNAADIVMGLGPPEPVRGELTYVEGYALPRGIGLPIHHAWLVDKRGNVIDVTWPDGGDEYFGVPFTVQQLYDSAEKTGMYGMISSRRLAAAA